MLNHNSSTPLYIQLANFLTNMIYRGEYKAGAKLPSENELCKQFDVSRITVRQALTLLVQKELIYSVHGKGTFVKNPAINHELNKIVSFNRVLQQKGLNGYSRIKSFAPEASNEAAEHLLGKDLSNLNLIGFASHIPIVYYVSYFTPALGQKMYEAAQRAEEGNDAFSTYDLYENLGMSFHHIEQTLKAINADETLQQIMGLPKHQAVILLESIYYGEDGTPLEYKLAHYRSDIYSFHLHRQA